MQPTSQDRRVRVCASDHLVCPRCDTLVRRTTLDAGSLFAVCEGRVGAAGERCNANLFIACAEIVPAAEVTHALVTVVTPAERQEIRELTRRLRTRQADRDRERVNLEAELADARAQLAARDATQPESHAAA
jgi:hypothetical protein